MGGKKMFFGLKSFPNPNIFLGGAGFSYITEPANYITYTNGTVLKNVKNFQIDGNNNVSLFYGETHTLDRSFGNNKSEITYLIFPLTVSYADNSFVGFTNMINLKYLYIPGQTQCNNNSFVKLSSLEHLFFENVVNNLSAGGFKFNDVKLKVAKFNNLEIHTGAGFLASATLIERIYIPKLNNFKNPSFSYDSCFNLIKTNCKIYHNTEMGVKNRHAWGFIVSYTGGYRLGDVVIINGLTYTCVVGPPSADGEFDGVGSWITSRASLILAINNDTRTGTFGKVLAYAGGNFTIHLACDTVGVGGNTCNIDTSGASVSSTSGAFLKGGNDVHQCLMYARDERSAILIQVSTPISVNAPTSLSYSNLTSNSVKLNFTEPTPNANGTDCFEVWIEDSTLYRKLFEYSEISGSGQIVDLTEIVNDAESSGIGGIKIKIRTMDGQMNYSEFTDPITLP